MQVFENSADIDSPALLFYPDRIKENIRRTLAMAGVATHLRPPVKTHKCSEVLGMQMAAGIFKFQCATIAEAEMAAHAGAKDLLLACQPVGPRARRLIELIERFPNSQFSCIVDDESVILNLASLAKASKHRVDVFLDIDCGQARGGVLPDERAVALYKLVLAKPSLHAGGLHAYDGHIHERDFALRKTKCDDAFAPVEALRRNLISNGMSVPVLILGGTPTFAIHAGRGTNAFVELSPGTSVLWDAGYAATYPDLDFLYAAMVLTRVVSKPERKRLTLDLGHKAIASEGPHPRVVFPELIGCRFILHNEEHLVVEAENSADFKVGDCVLGIPWHICPTVALYDEAIIVTDNKTVATWKITARGRRITI